MDEFTLWMSGLDAVEVAKTNSFHSAAHREMLTNHQQRKTLNFLNTAPTRQELRQALKAKKPVLSESQLRYVRKVATTIINKKKEETK
jgi:hypothetical protein